MKLTANEIRAAVYVLRCHREATAHIPLSVTALSQRLESAVLHGEASPWRQPQHHDSGHLERVEWIGSQIVAGILGWNMRRVQRHSADLGGVALGDGDRLFYPRHTVEEYRDALHANRSDD